jgi:hypothetical protein
MVEPAQALIEAAGGSFENTLIAVLTLVIIGAFVLLLKGYLAMPEIIKAGNKELCDTFTKELRTIADVLRENKTDQVEAMKCNGEILKEHDKQARDGFKIMGEKFIVIDTTLKNRPCIATKYP